MTTSMTTSKQIFAALGLGLIAVPCFAEAAPKCIDLSGNFKLKTSTISETQSGTDSQTGAMNLRVTQDKCEKATFTYFSGTDSGTPVEEFEAMVVADNKTANFRMSFVMGGVSGIHQFTESALEGKLFFFSSGDDYTLLPETFEGTEKIYFDQAQDLHMVMGFTDPQGKSLIIEQVFARN